MIKPISQNLDALLTIYFKMSSVERENDSFVCFMQRLILNAAKSEELEKDKDFAWAEAIDNNE